MSAAAYLVNQLFTPTQNRLDGALRAVSDYRYLLRVVAELPEATSEVRLWASRLDDQLHSVWAELDRCRWSFPPEKLP